MGRARRALACERGRFPALITTDEKPQQVPFVCLDERLRDAARAEGFRVLPSE